MTPLIADFDFSPFALVGGAVGVLINILIFALWLWALIDAIRRDFDTTNTKVLWIVLICLVPCIGSIIYLAIGRK